MVQKNRSKSQRGTNRSGSVGPKQAASTLPVRPLESLFDFRLGEEVAENLVYDGVRRDGGMSVVLKVIHAVDHRPRACKILRPELADRPEAVENAIEEFGRAKRVTGKHAVSMYDLGRLSAQIGEGEIELPFFTMEWVEGDSLAESLRANPQGFEPRPAFRLALQVANGLASLHAVDELVHLDLKPSNILVDHEGVLKIIDFGIGRDLRGRHDAQTAGRWLTSAYAPWELAEGRVERVCPASDVFQAAVIIYELFSGAPTRNVSYKALSDRIDFVPASLDELILSCLSDDPAARLRDGAELYRRLEQVHREYMSNRKAGRRHPSTKPKELWEKLKLVAHGEPRLWEYQAALARDLLDELADGGGGGGFFGLGARIDPEDVERLLREAETELRTRRAQRFRRLLDRGDWEGAGEMLGELEKQIAEEELAAYRKTLEIEQGLARPEDRGARLEARQRALEFLAAEGTSPWMRERMVAVLQRVMTDLPGRTETPPIHGANPPSSWACTLAGSTSTVVVAPGNVLRLGRGSWLDAGSENHVDLRPTLDEVEAEPKLAELCLQISHRAFEIRIGDGRVEAHVEARFGAAVDGRDLKKGSSAELSARGQIAIAIGASQWSYLVLRDALDSPVGVILEGRRNVGEGRRIVLAAGPLALDRLFPALPEGLVTIVPSGAGWQVTPHGPGFNLGGRALEPERIVPWPEDARLTGPGGLAVTWSGPLATAARTPAPVTDDGSPR